jgi:hypothetical protein
MADLTNVLVPTKEAGKFTCNEDLNRSLKKREELQYQGKLICNWILQKQKEFQKMEFKGVLQKDFSSSPRMMIS